MDPEVTKFASLERRVFRLERRVARLEAELPQGVAPPEPAGTLEPFGPPAHPAAVHPAAAHPPVTRQEPPPRPAWMPPAPAAPARSADWAAAAPAPSSASALPATPAVSAPVAHAEPATPEATPSFGAAVSAAPAWSRPEPKPALSLRDLEERFAGRALAWVGGIALVAAAVFFLSLAFSRGWITEPMRVLIGLVAGGGAFALGAVLLARRNPLMGSVLSGVGLGVVSLALVAATRIYGLVPPEVGLLGALVAATAAAIVAVRFDARSVAAFGLVTALAAPPLVGASPDLLTLLFVAVALVGSTAVALFRSWRWLPSLAFVLAAPQLASWLIGDPVPAQALVAIAGFWLVNLVAAAGEEVRIRRDDLRPSSAVLVLANGVFLLWGLWVVLVGDLAPWLGTAIALASLAHVLVGWWFLARQGFEHLFGNLVAGTGVALLAIACFVQLGAPAVPVAWAAEAVALAWLAVRRRHRWSAAAALALGMLAVAHLVLLEYPVLDAGIPAGTTFGPVLHPEAGSAVAVLLALAVAGVLVPIRWVRSALAAVGIVIAAYVLTFEAVGTELAAALVVTGLAGLLLDRLVERSRPAGGLEPVASWVRFGWIASVAALVPAAMTVVLLLHTEFPVGQPVVLAATPFLNAPCASLAIALGGLVAAGALVGVPWIRSAFAGTGLLLVAWALGFQVAGLPLIGLLAALLPAGIILDRGLVRLPADPRFRRAAFIGFDLFATIAGALAWGAAALTAAAGYLNPLDWGSVTPPDVPFTDERAVAAALLALAALAAVRWLAPMALRRVALIAAILVGAWVVPFEVYADLVVVLWVALAASAVVAAAWDRRGEPAYALVASALWVLAAFVAVGIVAPPDRLWVVDPAWEERLPLLPMWWASFAALVASAFAAGRFRPFNAWRVELDVTAGVAFVYGLSVAVVDVFQRQVGGSVAVEELAKQAQVALSVCWTALGATSLVVGLVRHRAMLRHAGFALLALATAKVFVIDLASLDVAYRALVLAGLGVLLLASAWLFTHFRGPRAGPTGVAGGPQPAA